MSWIWIATFYGMRFNSMASSSPWLFCSSSNGSTCIVCVLSTVNLVMDGQQQQFFWMMNTKTAAKAMKEGGNRNNQKAQYPNTQLNLQLISNLPTEYPKKAQAPTTVMPMLIQVYLKFTPNFLCLWFLDDWSGPNVQQLKVGVSTKAGYFRNILKALLSPKA